MTNLANQHKPSSQLGESKFIDIDGLQLHYRESGTGCPIIFLHGMPVSSYLWRNITPHFDQHWRCISFDLPGMGQSGSTKDNQYRIFDHIYYIHQAIKQLALKNIVFVLHGWGSLVGFEYARKYAKNVAGLAVYEGHLRPILSEDMISLPLQELVTSFSDVSALEQAVLYDNYMINKILPAATVRGVLTDEIVEQYAKPFLSPEKRLPLLHYLKEIPLGIQDSEVVRLIADYSKFLCTSKIPKFLLYAVPGYLSTIDSVAWARDNFPNISLGYLGDAMHFAQESHPELFSNLLYEWVASLNTNEKL